VVVDVQGYYSQGEGLVPTAVALLPRSATPNSKGSTDHAPVRVLDTRPGSGQQDAGPDGRS